MISMYDSTQPNLIPTSAEYIAIYGNGKYAASRDAVQDRFPKARVFSIDVLGTAPQDCGIADVENFDMTPADVPGWVSRRLEMRPGTLCRIYCNKSTWPAVLDEVAKLTEAQRDRVRYWIADPTGTAHMVTGADACQWYWGDNWDTSEIDAARFAPRS
jgi:hypothetical protein